MSKSHLACFKHLKRNCKCGSPQHLNLHHSTRLPPDGKKQAWKEFAKWISGGKNPYIQKEIEDRDVFKNLL